MADGVEKRVRYFTGEFLQVEDFTDEQAYHIDRQQRHSRLLHTPGIAEGLGVTADVGGTSIEVEPGTALDAEGRQIVLTDTRVMTLNPSEHAGKTLLVVVNYAEAPSDPATVGEASETRWHERPVVSLVVEGEAPPESSHIRLMRLTSDSAGAIAAVDEGLRVRAGVRVGDQIEARRVALSREGEAPALWPELSSGAAGRADLKGDLQIDGGAGVSGDLHVSGSASVDGDVHVSGTLHGALPGGSVSRNELANGAVDASKIATGAVGRAQLANGSVDADKLADGAVESAKLAKGAVAGDNLADGTVDNSKLANGAVNAAKLAANAVTTGALQNNAVTEPKLDAAVRAKLDGGLGRSGGTIDGSLVVNRSYVPPKINPTPVSRIAAGGLTRLADGIGGITRGTTTGGTGGIIIRPPILFPTYGVRSTVTEEDSTPKTVAFGPSAAIVAESQVDNIYGVHASASGNTYALMVQGKARVTGGVTSGHIVETFINGGDEVLRTGDIVKLKGTPVTTFRGDDNKIPIPEVTLADRPEDCAVIGVVDCEALPAAHEVDARENPDDPTSVEPGGEVSVVILGSYAHCKVDATDAPIEVGDLLTTAGNAGHASKAVQPKLGTIIGKALEPLAEGTGYIAVLVNIQ